MSVGKPNIELIDDRLRSRFLLLLTEAVYLKADSVELQLKDSQFLILLVRQGHVVKINRLQVHWYGRMQQLIRQCFESDKSELHNSKITFGRNEYLFYAKTRNGAIIELSNFLKVDKDHNNYFRMPKEEAVETAASEKANERDSKKGPLIMLIEDDPDQREILTVMLTELEYDVVEAADGEEAIELLSKYEPDLLISDLMMPKVDGVELVRRVKNDRNFKHIPVLILTVISDPEKEYQLLELGVDDFCQKTMQRKILLKRIENLIRRSNDQ